MVFTATQPGARGRGITAFLVPFDRPGLSRLPGPDSLGVRGLGCMDLLLDDVHVAPDDVLGEVNGGFRLARWALDGGRVGIAAQSLGVGQAALHEAIAHAQRRQTFGRPIAKYQAVQWFVADMATELEAARLLTWKAASAPDLGTLSGAEAAMAKLAASESAHRAADKAMQVLASAGYRRGSLVERLFRDIRASEIYQGTSEVQRMIIAGAVSATIGSHSGLRIPHAAFHPEFPFALRIPNSAIIVVALEARPVPDLASSAALEGRSIVVVGGTSGIGLCAAARFLREGARVVALGLSGPTVASAQEVLGSSALVLGGNATLSDTVPKAIAAALRTFGRFDALYHVAGGSGRAWAMAHCMTCRMKHGARRST